MGGATLGNTGLTAACLGIGNVDTQYRRQKPNCHCSADDTSSSPAQRCCSPLPLPLLSLPSLIPHITPLPLLLLYSSGPSPSPFSCFLLYLSPLLLLSHHILSLHLYLSGSPYLSPPPSLPYTPIAFGRSLSLLTSFPTPFPHLFIHFLFLPVSLSPHLFLIFYLSFSHLLPLLSSLLHHCLLVSSSLHICPILLSLNPFLPLFPYINRRPYLLPFSP